MITQKGLKKENVFALISEDGLEVTFYVGIPECEKFAKTHSYSSVTECYRSFDRDVTAFIKSHASTTFTIHAEESEKEEVINDSWSSIFNDAKDGVKTRFNR